MREALSRTPSPTEAENPQTSRPRQMPAPAAMARLSPPTAAVRRTRAVSRPGVSVNRLDAIRHAISACETVKPTFLQQNSDWWRSRYGTPVRALVPVDPCGEPNNYTTAQESLRGNLN